MAGEVQVVCAGEAMVDFLPEKVGQAVRDVEHWRRCPGGAVANVAVGLARLGAKVAFVGVVGKDEFGSFLAQRLAAEGVDVRALRQTDEGRTGLAFVSPNQNGERSFTFFRTRAADLFLAESDIDEGLIRGARAALLGTNALLFRTAQRAALKLSRLAGEGGLIVACDPNVRLHLWPDAADLKDLLAALLPSCHVVKVSLDELAPVTGQTDPEAALRALHGLGVALPVVTLGDKGAVFLWQDRMVRVTAPTVNRVDPTGAGDGFTAALLFGLTRLYADSGALRFAGVGELRELVKFACGVGAKVVERLGAVEGLPKMEEIRGELPKLLRDASL